MSPRRPAHKAYTPARDGLVARVNGTWAKEKLSFLEEYMPPALQATKRFAERHYVDLFAGPGINVGENGREFDGGALRVVRATAQAEPEVGFTHATFVNVHGPSHDALEERLHNDCAGGRCVVPYASIRCVPGDANELVGEIMAGIPRNAYVFVFADIEAPTQLPFDTVRAIRAHGPRALDFCVLYPHAMALPRLLPYERGKLTPTVGAMTSFLGTERWLEAWTERITEADSPALQRRVQELYEEQLRSLDWEHVVEPRLVRRGGKAPLYKLLLASNHIAGKKLAEWSKGKQVARERGESLFDE